MTGFFTLASPLYKDISLKKEQIASYNEALANSKALEALRDQLTQKYNSLHPEDLSKIQKFLPDHVDNIRLILEIEKVASPYGMVLRDVRYDIEERVVSRAAGSVPGSRAPATKDYGVWGLEFSTQGTYNNFINFLKSLESNLRMVDVSSIEFSSNAGSGIELNPSLPEVYKYNFKIKTYWLKN